MKPARFEHVNMTVRDPRAVADRLIRLFDWKVRWQGPSMNDGLTVHVGTDDAYVALYTHAGVREGQESNYDVANGLNHIAVVVDDLDAVEDRIRGEGLETYNHGNYEPGRRFYFDDPAGFEVEVVSYAEAK